MADAPYTLTETLKCFISLSQKRVSMHLQGLSRSLQDLFKLCRVFIRRLIVVYVECGAFHTTCTRAKLLNYYFCKEEEIKIRIHTDQCIR